MKKLFIIMSLISYTSINAETKEECMETCIAESKTCVEKPEGSKRFECVDIWNMGRIQEIEA